MIRNMHGTITVASIGNRCVQPGQRHNSSGCDDGLRSRDRARCVPDRMANHRQPRSL